MPSLRPYQKEDLAKLLTLNSAGIFSEQRTGKTPIAIEYAKAKRCNKILIVCPASAIPVWISEWSKWYPEQKCVGVTGYTRTNKKKQIESWENVLAITYDSLKSTKKRIGFIEDIQRLCYKTNGVPDLVIIDEAHRIQTRDSASTSAVYKLINAPHKLALSGTPASNKPYQIFSILRWLYPKTFRSYWKYVAEFYATEQKRNWQTGNTWTDIGDFLTEEKKTEHAEILNKISVQHKRKEVMKWLPEKDYTLIKLAPYHKQKQAIDYLKKYYEVGEIETQGILDRLIRERQLCLCPALLGIDSESPKTDWIIQYLKDYPERKILIFSKFTSYLKVLAGILTHSVPERQLELYIGETTVAKRAQIVKDFQENKLNLLLLNIDAAKEAITLDTAEVAIFTDKYPPVGSIQQAEDRFVATTEEKKDKQHSIIELCITDTYDERLYELIKHNAEMTDVINDYYKYLKEEH